MFGNPALRCKRAETTRDCPVSHQWTESNGRKKAYHATFAVQEAARRNQPQAANV